MNRCSPYPPKCEHLFSFLCCVVTYSITIFSLFGNIHDFRLTHLTFFSIIYLVKWTRRNIKEAGEMNE